MFSLNRKYALAFFILIDVLLIYLIYILIKTPSSSGYEPSIYAMYPVTFWVIYFVIYLFSLCPLLYSIFIKHDRLYSYAGLFNLSILTSILLLLPLFRSYLAVNSGDTLIHLGYIRDILTTHHLAEHTSAVANPYPLSHILSSVLILITNIKLETVVQIMPVIFFSVYVLFSYRLLGTLYKDNQRAILLLLFVLVPIIATATYYPSQMVFCFIPMFLYVCLKYRSNPSRSSACIIIILIACFPIMHPVSSFHLLVLIAIVSIVWYFTNAKDFKLHLTRYANFVMIFVVILLVWTISFTNIVGSIAPVFLDRSGTAELAETYEFQTEEKPDDISKPSNILSRYYSDYKKAELSILDAIILYIRLLGVRHLLIGIAAVFSIYGICNWIRGKRTNKLNMALSLICLVYIILYITSFLYPFRFPAARYLLGGRIHLYVLFISILINTNYIFELVGACKSKVRKIAFLVLIMVMFFSMTYVSTSGFYNSAFNRKPSSQVTHMYASSMNWLISVRNRKLPIEELENRQHQISYYLLGANEANLEPNLKAVTQPSKIPAHFNYNNERRLAKTLKEDCYVVINKMHELISVNIYPEYEDRWSFHPDDYKELESDISIDKIYHNGEIRVFYVNGMR